MRAHASAWPVRAPRSLSSLPASFTPSARPPLCALPATFTPLYPPLCAFPATFTLPRGPLLRKLITPPLSRPPVPGLTGRPAAHGHSCPRRHLALSAGAGTPMAGSTAPVHVQCGVRFLELASQGMEKRKAAISDIHVRALDTPSRFVQPQSIHFLQDGKARRWDMVASHPSVAILIYHKGLSAILMVRQFRPPAYISACAEVLEQAGTPQAPSTSGMSAEEIARLNVPLDKAFTYELCAGLVDKDGKSLSQVAKEEVAEETGYDVPVESLQVIATALSAVGMAGSKQTLFYTEVDESQRSLQGGGNEHEGEAIDLVGLPLDQIDAFIASTDIPKSPGALFALAWFQLRNSKNI